jgi:hypothetical protein
VIKDADGNIPQTTRLLPRHTSRVPTGRETRTAVVQLAAVGDIRNIEAYLRRNDCVYRSGDATGGCTVSGAADAAG